MPDFLSLLQLQQEREENARLKRAVALKESYGINFYRPHAKQHRFHTVQAVGRYGRTGNRFGKSEMGISEDIAWCLGGRVWYREAFDIRAGNREIVERHPGGRNHPYIRQGIPDRPVKGLLIVVDWDMSKRIFTNNQGSYETWGKLFKLLPRESVGKVNVTRGGHIDQVEIKRPTEFGGGSSTLSIDTIESFKHNKLSAESADWDFIHVDEPCPEGLFQAHARGLMDRNGSYWFTCTPLSEMWINDKFTPKKSRALVQHAPDGIVFDQKFIITGDTYDNPFRSDAGVAEFESGLSKDERACRLHGLPFAMAGKVYKEFVYDEHVLDKVPAGWETYNRPPKNYTVRIWLDYHTRKPQAVLFLATGPDGTVYVFDEMFDENLIDAVAKAIVRKSEGYFVCDREIDPFAFIPSPVTEESVQDEFLKYGLYFEKATKDRRTGILKVRERLLERNIWGRPTIYFSPHLTETLYEFDHYVFDTDKEEPKDKDDHMMENLYRAVLNGLSYIEPPDMESLNYRRGELTVHSNEDQLYLTPQPSLNDA